MRCLLRTRAGVPRSKVSNKYWRQEMSVAKTLQVGQSKLIIRLEFGHDDVELAITVEVRDHRRRRQTPSKCIARLKSLKGSVTFSGNLAPQENVDIPRNNIGGDDVGHCVPVSVDNGNGLGINAGKDGPTRSEPASTVVYVRSEERRV